MRQQAVSILLALFVAISAWAADQTETPEARRTKTLSILRKVDAFMKNKVQPSPQLVIVISDMNGVAYSSRGNAIFVSQLIEPLLIHEYGHALLDEYLVQNSEAWLYFKARRMFDRKTLPQAVADMRTSVANLEKTLSEFKISHPGSEFVTNLERSLRKENITLSFLISALPLDEKYKHHHEQVDFFSLLAPYHELLADTLAVVMANDWNLMSDQLREYNRTSDEKMVVPEGATEEKIFWHRGFHRDVAVENYDFKSWEEENPYTQFAPMRSYLRSLFEDLDESSKHLRLILLAKAIQMELDERVQNKSLHQITAKEKNQRLKKRIEDLLH
mgnify:CR=1 FL=1